MKSKTIVKKESLRSTHKEYSFFEDVYDVARQIPKERFTFFGAIANYFLFSSVRSFQKNILPNYAYLFYI